VAAAPPGSVPPPALSDHSDERV